VINSDAIINNQRINYETVEAAANNDLVSHSISLGISGMYSKLITLRLRVEKNINI